MWCRRRRAAPAPVVRVPTLFGVGTTRLGGWAALEALTGTIPVRRSYDPDFRPFALSRMAADVGKRASVYSFKTDAMSMSSGVHDDALEMFVATIPRGHRCWIAWRHEPEDDTVTPEGFCTGFDRFARIVKSAGRPEIVPTLILMGWTFDQRSGRDYRAWLPSVRDGVCAAIDHYNMAPDAPWRTPGELFDGALNALRAAGFAHVGIAETACKTTVDDVRQVEWIKQLGVWAAAQTDLDYVCWFDSDVGDIGDWWLTPATAAAWGVLAHG